MDRTRVRDSAEQPVERFKPTTGGVVGWLGIAVAVGMIVYVSVAVHSRQGLQVGLGALFALVLVWVTQLRPRVTAYPRHLLLKGSVRDVAVPYVAVDELTMGQTLNVWVRGRRYVCIGIGKPLGYDVRQRMRAHNQGGVLGTNRVVDPSGRSDFRSRAPDLSYESFVMTRLGDLVAEARAEQRAAAVPADASVRPAYAVPEIVALVVTGLAFLASLLA